MFSLEQIERARIQRVIDENPEVFQEMIDEIQGWNISVPSTSDDAQTSDSPVSDKNVLSKAIKKMREKWENFINTRSSESSDLEASASSTLDTSFVQNTDGKQATSSLENSESSLSTSGHLHKSQFFD